MPTMHVWYVKLYTATTLKLTIVNAQQANRPFQVNSVVYKRQHWVGTQSADGKFEVTRVWEALARPLAPWP